jgi:hypothetical protein
MVQRNVCDQNTQPTRKKPYCSSLRALFPHRIQTNAVNNSIAAVVEVRREWFDVPRIESPIPVEVAPAE